MIWGRFNNSPPPTRTSTTSEDIRIRKSSKFVATPYHRPDWHYLLLSQLQKALCFPSPGEDGAPQRCHHSSWHWCQQHPAAAARAPPATAASGTGSQERHSWAQPSTSSSHCAQGNAKGLQKHQMFEVPGIIPISGDGYTSPSPSC